MLQEVSCSGIIIKAPMIQLVNNIDCEQSVSFPNVFRARARSSGENRGSGFPPSPQSLLVFSPNLHNYNISARAKVLRRKDRNNIDDNEKSIWSPQYCFKFWAVFTHDFKHERSDQFIVFKILNVFFFGGRVFFRIISFLFELQKKCVIVRGVKYTVLKI